MEMNRTPFKITRSFSLEIIFQTHRDKYLICIGIETKTVRVTDRNQQLSEMWTVIEEEEYWAKRLVSLTLNWINNLGIILFIYSYIVVIITLHIK